MNKINLDTFNIENNIGKNLINKIKMIFQLLQLNIFFKQFIYQ